MIGGIGPESTVDYYQLLTSLYRGRHPQGSYPSLLINSIDLRHALELIETDRHALVDFITRSFEEVARAGADFGAILSNTPHVVFEDIAKRSPIPLISIVDTARDRARQKRMSRLGLFGTRFTMESDFYRRAFAEVDIEVISPREDERVFIHDKYFGELVKGKIIESTRSALVEIAQAMATREGIHGLILGGTELSLILRDERDTGMQVLDTTRIHAEAIVDRLLES